MLKGLLVKALELTLPLSCEYIGYKLPHLPTKLLTIYNATDVLVEDWHFRQAAYHTFHADDVARVEIRRRTATIVTITRL